MALPALADWTMADCDEGMPRELQKGIDRRANAWASRMPFFRNSLLVRHNGKPSPCVLLASSPLRPPKWIVPELHRQVDGNVAREPNGRVTGKFIFEVPLGAADGLVNKIKGIGNVRVQRSSRNTQVPDSALALARLEVTLSNQELIVPSDEGPWTQLRKGLSTSLVAIFWSLSWLIFGVLVLLPWALIIYAIYRIVLRLRCKPDVATPAA